MLVACAWSRAVEIDRLYAGKLGAKLSGIKNKYGTLRPLGYETDVAKFTLIISGECYLNYLDRTARSCK